MRTAFGTRELGDREGGRDKRETYATKGPEDVGLKASMLTVIVASTYPLMMRIGSA